MKIEEKINKMSEQEKLELVSFLESLDCSQRTKDVLYESMSDNRTLIFKDVNDMMYNLFPERRKWKR